MVHGKARIIFRKIHTWIGLWCGIVFIIMGLSGSLIAWLPELDAALNPTLLRASPMTASDAMLPTAIAARIIIDKLAANPAYGIPTQIWTPREPHGVYIAWYRRVSPGANSPFAQPVARQVMIDPYSLTIKGERDWGRSGLSRPLLLPTLYHLHHYLLLGEAGKTIIGITAVMLLLATIFGLVLWWPKASWRSFRQAVSVTYGASRPRLYYSFHRAAGFFVAPFFVLLAFSGLYFTFPQWVIPAVSQVLPVSPKPKLSNESSASAQALPTDATVALAQALYPGASVTRIAMPGERNAPFEIRLRQEGERQESGATRLTVDALSGKILRISDPLRASSGDTFLSWQFPLHSGQAFGAAGKLVISIVGLLPLLLALSGMSVWLKKKSGKPMNRNYFHLQTLPKCWQRMPQSPTSFFFSPHDMKPSNLLSTASHLTRLGMLKKGELAIVRGVEASTDNELQALKTRLLELGFVAGEKIRIVAESFPGRDPIAVRLGNTTFALRRHEASMIHVIPCKD